MEKGLAELKTESSTMKLHWGKEKEIIKEIQALKQQIEASRLEEQRAERAGNLEKVAQIRYGTLIRLNEQLQAASARLNEIQKDQKMLKEEVDAEDIAEVVAKWTGVPVSKMMEGELEKLITMEDRIRKRVIGQDEAIQAVADAVYAQSHPSEDFAETFAVWLNPYSQWRTRYRGWPAMRKLRYVDRLMREVAARPLPRRTPRLDFEARATQARLRSYYERKFRLYRVCDLSSAVQDLKGIFTLSRAARIEQPASALIRKNKRLLVESVSAWSGQKPGEVARVVARLAKLCDEHRLAVRDEPAAALVRVSAYVSTLSVNRMRVATRTSGLQALIGVLLGDRRGWVPSVCGRECISRPVSL